MHKVSIDALQPGMVIIAISQQQGPVAIKKSGLVTSVDMVNGLREMGVTEVEIDPEQTVEIDGAPVLSPNHKLVSRQHHVQHTQSEQFNRSLFLPSIADIPSQWQEAWNETKFYALRIGSGLLVGAALAVVSQFILRGDWPNRALPITQEAEQAESQLSALSDSAQGTDEKTAVPAQTTGEQTGGPVASASETNEESPIVSSPPAETATQSEVQSSAAEQQAQGNDMADEVDPELLARFNEAVKAVSDEPADNTVPTAPAANTVPRVDQLPAWILTALPRMQFSTHMYASDPEGRWVRVNGVELHEGEWLTDKLQLLEITPQKVIMSYQGNRFSLNALTDW
ncbi:general secretion pathway protein GspB [Bowmanella sp. JS7-9]|uniref:General secretion pathway protein GspB n=1 Tax=Pseudobowmanella zhangzhouensis TaxID=1537679 RepID=A0ABW1XL28_9ALTE|nr:general secretion pathway protein GspB [Bowmanella sp. JS7-9]TBX25751.1 hypothetical protein TK45_03420 [Bowmanella sp. JS7-9]